MIHPRATCGLCGKSVALIGGWPDQYFAKHAMPGTKQDCPATGSMVDPDPAGTVAV